MKSIQVELYNATYSDLRRDINSGLGRVVGSDLRYYLTLNLWATLNINISLSLESCINIYEIN